MFRRVGKLMNAMQYVEEEEKGERERGMIILKVIIHFIERSRSDK